MSDESSDSRRLVSARITPDMWSELDAIRRKNKWSWQTLLVDMFEFYLAAVKRRSSGGGK